MSKSQGNVIKSTVFNFVVIKWNAWAPGINDLNDWLNGSKGDLVVQQEKAVVLDSVPKMLQRRLSPLAKQEGADAVLLVLYDISFFNVSFG